MKRTTLLAAFALPAASVPAIAQLTPAPPVRVNSASSTTVPRIGTQAASSSVVPWRCVVVYGRDGTQTDCALAISADAGDHFGTEQVLSGTNCGGGTLGRMVRPSAVASRVPGDTNVWVQAIVSIPPSPVAGSNPFSGSAPPWRS